MELHHNVQEDLSYGHRPVLLEKCLDALCIRPDGVYVDGTLGRAGHSLEIARRLTTGRLIGIDRDNVALEAAAEFAGGGSVFRGEGAVEVAQVVEA